MSATNHGRRLVALPVAAVSAVALTLGLAGPADASSGRQDKIDHAFQIAQHQKGDPYVYGAEGPDRFDCSGLLYYSFRKAGISIPRTSDAQADQGRRIAREDMRKGDLIAFYGDGGDVYHIGIFAGWNGHQKRLVLHAPNSDEVVQVDPMWAQNWYAVTMR